MNSNIIARFFEWNREVVESAETPIMKFVVMLLPVVTPFVPAMITGLRLYGLYFDEIGEMLLQYVGPTPIIWAAIIAAFITALAIELLGWVGAIAFIRNVYHFMRNERDGVLLSVGLTGIAYLFYIACIFLVNSQLSAEIPNKASVFGLLIFLTVPAGLIYADGMAEKQTDERDRLLRREKRDERLEKYRIKHGARTHQDTEKKAKDRHAGDFKEYVFELLDAHQGQIALTEITRLVNKGKRVELVHRDVKGTWHKFVKEWQRSRGKT